MNWRAAEPRTVMWARAEVSWVDWSGVQHRMPATMEDTSVSGACIRVGGAIEIGSNLTVKRHREQFSGIARNRRPDGNEFLVGIQRIKSGNESPAATPPITESRSAKERSPTGKRVLLYEPAVITNEVASLAASGGANTKPCTRVTNRNASGEKAVVKISTPKALLAHDKSVSVAMECADKGQLPSRRDDVHRPMDRTDSCASSRRELSRPAVEERKTMQSKSLFEKFWRHKPEPAAGAGNAGNAEVPVNNSDDNHTEVPDEPRSSLLSCEDIYRASGILGSRSKYGINKIVEMINSKHVHELPKEVRRASVLMALDAAGASVDDVLNDASRRLHALNVYEAGQQKQFEQFEASKARENSQLKLEIERVTAHYADRIQTNLDEIAREKEAFSNWQAMKEQETQRISEAVALCGKQSLAEPAHDAAARLTSSTTASSAVGAGSTSGGTGSIN